MKQSLLSAPFLAFGLLFSILPGRAQTGEVDDFPIVGSYYNVVMPRAFESGSVSEFIHVLTISTKDPKWIKVESSREPLPFWLNLSLCKSARVTEPFVKPSGVGLTVPGRDVSRQAVRLG